MDKNNRKVPKSTENRVIRTSKPTKNRKVKKTVKVASKAVGFSFSTVTKILLGLLLVLLITCCIVGTVITVYVMKAINADVQIDLTSLDLTFTSKIYATNEKNKVVQIDSLSNGSLREWVDITKVPQVVLDAIVFTEDKRFYDHEGVDWKRTIGSFANLFFNLYDTRQGGSTITQQLVKVVNGDYYGRSIEMKVNEIIQAMNIERHFTKRQILQAYINIIPFGHGTHGIQAASKYYFNKDVSKLTVVESAALAAAIKAPETRNVKTDPEANADRRVYTLDMMLENGAINQSEHKEALKAKVKVYKKQNTTSDDLPIVEYNSYYVDAVIEDAIAALMDEFDYSYQYAQQQLLTGGYQIYTCMDTKMQETLTKKFENYQTFYPTASPKNPHQAAMVIMDYEGHVKALSGGMGKKEGDRVLNRATGTTRSPGSAIKPLSIYAPAFDMDLIHWSEIMVDSPAKQIPNGSGGTRPWPNNYNFVNQGPMTIIDAIRVSKNTIPAKLSMEMTPIYSVKFLQDTLGISTLVTTGKNTDVGEASMAIASMRNGMILKETVAAYSMFGNGGYYYKPVLFTKITDANGKVLVDNTPKPRKAIGSDTAYIMNKALWQVVNTQGASGTEAKLQSGMPTIGKTGTSDDRKDLAFVGLTPYYMAGIWYGYDMPKPLGYDSYSQMRVWSNVMGEILKGYKIIDFDIPSDGVLEEYFCTLSGNLATSSCSGKRLGYYKKTHMPDYCSSHASKQSDDSDKEEDEE